MWTANITNVTKDSHGLSFEMIVDFTDGNVVNTIPFKVSDPTSIKRIVQNQINQYNAIDAFIAKPPIGLVDLTPETPILPTQKELDARAYEKKRQELIIAKQDLDLKIIDQTTYNIKLDELIAIKP